MPDLKLTSEQILEHLDDCIDTHQETSEHAMTIDERIIQQSYANAYRNIKFALFGEEFDPKDYR